MCKLHPILQKTNNLQLPPQPIFFEPKISKEMAPLLAPPKRALKVWREVWVEKKKSNGFGAGKKSPGLSYVLLKEW